jgi:hypothetical protein
MEPRVTLLKGIHARLSADKLGLCDTVARSPSADRTAARVSLHSAERSVSSCSNPPTPSARGRAHEHPSDTGSAACYAHVELGPVLRARRARPRATRT